MKTFKKALSLFLAMLMLSSSLVSTSIFASENSARANEITSQAQEPEEHPLETSPSAVNPNATALKDADVIIPEKVTDTYNGICGDNLTWSLDTETGVLTIDGTGDMYDYIHYMLNSPKAPWSDYVSDITSVVIGDLVTRIGDSAFINCTALTNVTIPASVKSIGEYAFGALSEIAVDADNQYYSSDEFGVLYNKDKSELILYPIENTRTTFPIPDSVKIIGERAFENCTSLVSITIPDSVEIIGESAFRSCTSLVSIVIPDSVTTMGDYAFYSCSSLENVSFGNSVTTISYSAFNGCTLLTNISIPDSVTSINQSAFESCTSLVSIVIPDSVTDIGGASFCFCSSLTDIVLPDSLTTIPMLAFDGTAYYNDPDNWEDGVLYIGKYFIGCETSLSGEYVIKDGTLCVGQYAFKNTPSLTSVVIPDSVKNVNYLAFHNCASLSDVTVLGFDTILEQLTYPNMGNRDFTIHCYEGSVAHTFAVDNGFKYDFIEEPPSVSSDGLKITVDGLRNIKDFFIAKGNLNSYKEIKNNGYIFSVTQTKIGDKNSYSYTVSEPGVHTVLVRYNDGREYIFHETLTVDEPVFTTNGLQVTISNIPDVKTIRTAYGEYNTPGEVKRAEGARNFSGRSAIMGKDPYTIQYRDEGIVTVSVEYNNGYVKVFHYNVEKKTPTVEHSGNTVTFGDLEGLVTLRYAKGEYTAVGEIKRANGSKALKPANIADGRIEVALDPGTYTFCVQYDDESYNYYTITVE